MSTLHERLLAKLTDLDGWTIGDDGMAGPVNFARDYGQAVAAVRAVVELHAPEFFGGVIACLACSPGMPPQILIEAPCPTITAIAEALGIGETR